MTRVPTVMVTYTELHKLKSGDLISGGKQKAQTEETDQQSMSFQMGFFSRTNSSPRQPAWQLWKFTLA